MDNKALSYVRTTHDVVNQPLPLGDFDAHAQDRTLCELVERTGLSWLRERLSAYGRVVGSLELREHGRLANAHPPVLRSHDRFGHRIDEVEYHPSYHALMRAAMAHQVHSAAWVGQPGGQLAHACLMYLHTQVEAGSGCPLTMTHAVVPALRGAPSIAASWLPRLLGTEYDPRAIPAEGKSSATMGMAMTEKQGGSDVRANSTEARPEGAGGSGEPYLLTGHKWFCSAPMSDAFLTLAQTGSGLSCFLVPRFLPDGSRNRFLIQRLKDKLGNRSNASSEIEYDRTWGVLIGEEGRGVPAILPMVAQTRVDCAAGSAGLMRVALVEALHHTRQRAAFGKKLADQPLMQRVLADLALESEAALRLALRVAQSYDDAAHPERGERERLFARVATAIAKYWITRRAPGFAFEAMECLGGAGYVEESVLPRIYREAPVNSIWEGSGNVQCLDVLRTLTKEPATLDALLSEIAQAPHHALLKAELAALRAQLLDAAGREARARHLVERLAMALSASLLLRDAPAAVADAYCATRLGGQGGAVYGTLPQGVDARALLERALPG